MYIHIYIYTEATEALNMVKSALRGSRTALTDFTAAVLKVRHVCMYVYMYVCIRTTYVCMHACM